MLDLRSIREQFPALNRQINGKTPIYLDGPGGTQVPNQVLQAMVHYLRECNANHGGRFTTSRESDSLLEGAHQAVADLLNAPYPEEVIFGQNMTTLTFQISRALARTWRPGDTVLVTRLDHDANIRPWVLAAQDAGAEVRWVEVDSNGNLQEEDLRHHLSGKVRLCAFTCASNALGTVPPFPQWIRWAHQAGALVFLDAVHFAPHRLLDVQAWDCDFLVCSAYKFFGPHLGILWGRRSLLEQLQAYKVKPAPVSLPGKWMTGTQNHEGIVGLAGCIDYLTSLGHGLYRRQKLVQAMQAIQHHETKLAERLLSTLAEMKHWRVWGELHDLNRRVPTVALTHATRTPEEVVQHLANQEIYAWAGNFYAVELTEALGLAHHGGFVRLGLVHYNTMEEVERTLQVLQELA